jgi:hypothetical protein
MSMRVQGPDGKIIEFPDGMSEQDIAGVMQKHYGAPTQSTPAAPELDKYQQAAQEDLGFAKSIGRDQGYGRRILQGATFGWGDEILAAGQTPLEMIKRGTFDPSEAYAYTKAREDALLQDARDKTGALGSAGEIAGGMIAAAPVKIAQTALGTIANAAKSGATYGAVAGAGEGSGIGDRVSGAVGGGVLGGTVGAAIPAIGTALSGPVSMVRGLINPKGVAESHLARAVANSGKNADDVVAGVRQAATEGQGGYTVADELGNAGQRMLSTVARAPGAGRTKTVEFLEGRQAGQSSRVANFLDENFGTTKTAKMVDRGLTEARRAEGNAMYGAARREAGAVDPSAAINAADDILRPGASGVMAGASPVDNTSVMGAIRRARSYLTDGKSVVSDFDGAMAAKIEIDNMIETAPPSLQRLLKQVRDPLDKALETASKPYAKARDTYRTFSEAKDAIPMGKTASSRGRPEDTLDEFGRLKPHQQAGYRTGYGASLIEKVQKDPAGTNSVRRLTADKYAAEIPALAKSRDAAELTTRRLGRESTMFETRRQATGGSGTAENLADMDAMALDPTIWGNIAAGNFTAGLGAAGRRFLTTLSGYTPAVREELSGLLLQRGIDPQLVQSLERVMENSLKARQDVLKFLGGAAGGTAATPGALSGNAPPRR